MNYKDLKKGKKKTYPFPGRIYAKASLPFVWMALFLHLTPNMVSVIMIISIFASAVSFFFGINWLGILLLWTSAVLDHTDGWVARIINKISPLQCQYLDRIYHDCSFAFIFLGLGFGTTFGSGNILYLLLGISAMIGLLISSFVYTLTNWILIYWGNKKIGHNNLAYLGARGLTHHIYQILVFPMRYIIFILTLFALCGWLKYAVIFYGLFLPSRAFGYIIKNYYTIGSFQK